MRICDQITSRNNPKIKWVASLTEKKRRAENRSFFVEGEKLMIEAFSSGLPLTHLFIKAADLERILALIKEKGINCDNDAIDVIPVSEEVFDKISTEKSPEGVITVIKYLDFFHYIDIIYKEEFFSSDKERVLALYSVRDPGNLGAVIRSATAFGVDHVVLSSDCADIYNHKTVRAAMGSLFHIKVSIVEDFKKFIQSAQSNGRRVYAAELRDGAKALSDVDLSAKDIFVIGNEGHGIPEDISAECNGNVYIPISAKTESLNASVAAAVFMWEQNKIL